MRKAAASAFSPSWMSPLHSVVPRDLSNGCFSPMGRIKDGGGMRWNAEEGPQNAWLTGSCRKKRDTGRGMCLWGRGRKPS